MIFALKSAVWIGFGLSKYFVGSRLIVKRTSMMSPGCTAPPTAFASGTLIDIARKLGEPGCGPPSGPIRFAGMTVNAGFFGSENFVGMIGSPTAIAWIVILPI